MGGDKDKNAGDRPEGTSERIRGYFSALEVICIMRCAI